MPAIELELFFATQSCVVYGVSQKLLSHHLPFTSDRLVYTVSACVKITKNFGDRKLKYIYHSILIPHLVSHL